MDAVVTVAPGRPFLADQIITELSDLKVDEEATPLVPGDSQGGTPGMTATGPAGPKWAMATGQKMTVAGDFGTAVGDITGVDLSNGSNLVTLSADSVLNRLNIDVRALPYFLVTGNIAADSFLRASNTTSLGVAPSGQPWVALQGTWGVQTNQAYSPSAAGYAAVAVLLKTANQQVQATIAAVGTGAPTAGIIARASNAANYYWADLNAAGQWRLGKTVNGVQTVMQQGTGSAIPSTLTLRVQGNQLVLVINATVTATATDNSLKAGSWAGLLSNGSAGSSVSRWDNFSVTDTSTTEANLTNAFTSLTRLAGVPDDLVLIDPEIAYDKVIFPGFVGNLWDHIKQMCAAYGYQCYSTGSKIGLTKAGKIWLTPMIPAGVQTSISLGDVAQQVQITNYQYTSTLQGVFFKADQVYSLEAGEVQEVSVTMKGTPDNLNNPVCVDGMDLQAKAGQGQYVVTGEDGYIMSPALWRDLGGAVTVRISDEAADEIIITITAPDDTTRAPYRISEGDDRPALWITGSGVLSDPIVHTIYTGAADAPQLTVDPVENIFIASRLMAFNAGSRLAASYSGPTVTLTLTGVPDIAIMRSAYTYTVPPVATQYLEPAAELTTWVGSLAGSLLRFGDAIYRVQTAAIGPKAVDLTLVQHTSFDDFDKVWAGKTFDQFDVAMGNEIEFSEWNVFPLTTGV